MRKASPTYNLKILHSEVSKEWHPTKNSKLKPEDVTPSSNKKVWWKRTKGHEWIATVSSRTNKLRGSNCPYCANHYSTRKPKNSPIK